MDALETRPSYTFPVVDAADVGLADTARLIGESALQVGRKSSAQLRMP